MVDLHIHSIFSDGTNHPIEILKKANELNLSCISITDHDSCDAYNELKKIKISDFYNGRFISGCEIKCIYNGISIELLAYGCDIEQLSKYFIPEHKIKIQEKYILKLKKVCRDMGMTIDDNIFVKNGNEFACPIFYRAIKKYECNRKYLPEVVWKSSSSKFLRKCWSNPESPFYVDESEDYPHVKELISIIHNCKGKAFLAHLYEYSIPNQLNFLNDLVSYGIDGMECYHSSFSDENTKYLLDFCKNKNILISGGSDFHGDHRPTIKMGTGRNNLFIPKDIIQNWNINFLS